MCVERTKPRFNKKEYLYSPLDPQIVIYYREVSKDDPRVFRVTEFEEALVVCPRGEINYIDTHGFYKLISIPARIVWVKTARLSLTIGIPRGMLPGDIGVNIDVVLILHNAEVFLKNLPKIAKEGAITTELIKEELRRLLLATLRNIGKIDTSDRRSLLESIHKGMNELIVRSWLYGFVVDVQSVGFSSDCIFSSLLGGGSS